MPSLLKAKSIALILFKKAIRQILKLRPDRVTLKMEGSDIVAAPQPCLALWCYYGSDDKALSLIARDREFEDFDYSKFSSNSFDISLVPT